MGHLQNGDNPLICDRFHGNEVAHVKLLVFFFVDKKRQQLGNGSRYRNHTATIFTGQGDSDVICMIFVIPVRLYRLTPSCLFVNCRNPSDFVNYVGRLCVSFCLSVCLCVCLPCSSHTVSAIMTKLVQTSAMVQLRDLSFLVNIGQRSRSRSPKNRNSYFRNNVR